MRHSGVAGIAYRRSERDLKLPSSLGAVRRGGVWVEPTVGHLHIGENEQEPGFTDRRTG
jgi:hypothetical protein